MKPISRRTLLTNGLKAGVGLTVLDQLNVGARVLGAVAHQTPTSSRFQPAFQKLDEFVTRHLNDIGAPGLTLALANRDGLLRESHYGYADLKAGIKVSSQTVFQIGSISKSFVAFAILQLAEEGKLDLHKPVTTYLPWLRVESAFSPFTTHHLLTHTSGLSGIPLLIRVAATTLKTGSPPGTRFVYSNIGYALLGFIIEAVDKRSFAESLRKRVIEPLGMTSSSPQITNAVRNRMAVGYGPLLDDRPFPAKGKLAEAAWVEVPEAAGSVASTARDMGAYMQMLLNRGVGPRGRILSEKSFELLAQPAIKAPFRGEEANYGYGLWNSSAGGNMLLRHTGGMVAFSSAMYADITDGIAAFASVNARLGGYRPVAVVRYALDLLSAVNNGKELPAAPPPPPSPEIIRNAADYAGTFTSPEGLKLVLKNEGERLILEHGNRRTTLEQAAPDRFIVKDPDFDLFLLTFGRDKEKVVEVFHGARWWTNESYTGPRSFEYPKGWNAHTGHYRSDSPWYGSQRFVIRKGNLLLNGEAPLAEVEPGVFRFAGDNGPDRIVFDTMLDGQTIRANFAGIEFYRTFTP